MPLLRYADLVIRGLILDQKLGNLVKVVGGGRGKCGEKDEGRSKKGGAGRGGGTLSEGRRDG